MSVTVTNVPPIVLPKGGDRGWSLRTEDQPKWVAAQVHCPKCRAPVSLTTKIHAIAPGGHVTPRLVCPHKDCGFSRFIQLHDWVPLWAIAFERFAGRRSNKPIWLASVHYCHAHTEAEAKQQFYDCEAGMMNRTRIVAVAPVVGYTVYDEEAKILTV